ncbi:MAG: hypothetical protein PWK00_00560, partial [Coxiella burnetii]|nr:hypothetical protein [Coxiella burnetii]
LADFSKHIASRPVHLAADAGTSFLFPSGVVSRCADGPHFIIRSFTDGHLGLLHVLATIMVL